MEYNKNIFQKTNDKKVLHKVRKRWVVISAALLMTIGGGAAATHVSADADVTKGTPSSTSTLKDRINQQLQKQTPVKKQAQSASSTAIVKQAAVLHNRIVDNAANHQGRNVVDQNAVADQKHNQTNAQAVRQNNNGQKHVQLANPNLMGKDAGTGSGSSEGKSSGNNSNKQTQQSDFDSDGLYSNAKNSGYYVSDKQKGTVYSNYSDYLASDQDGYNYGRVIVRYVDPTHKNQQVGTLGIMGPIRCSDNPQPFGSQVSDGHGHQISSNVKAAITNIPRVFNENAPLGYQYAGIDSGKDIQDYIAGRDQFLTINVTPKQPATKAGEVLVEYEDKTRGNKIINSSQQSDSDGQSFSDAFKGFVNNAPEGYTATGYNVNSDKYYPSDDKSSNSSTYDTVADVNNGKEKSTARITNFNGHKAQVLHIFMEPSSSYTTAIIQYRDVGNNNTVVGTRTVQGKVNDPISSVYSNLTTFLPAGYYYAGNNDLGTTKFAYNGAATAYVDIKKNNTPVPNPKPMNYGEINANYVDQNSGTTISSISFTGPNKTQFDKNGNADRYADVPYGYSLSNGNNEGSSSLYYNDKKVQSDNILVKSDGSYRPDQIIPSYVEYEEVDPNKPSDPPTVLEKSEGNPYKFTLYGKPGTLINYSQYTQVVPSGYVYYNLGSHNSRMEKDQVNYVLVEQASNIAKPLNIHYINQSGDDIDKYSTAKKKVSNYQNDKTIQSGSDNTPIDEIPIQGTYGQKFNTTGGNASSDISNIRPVPKGYKINLSDKNATYVIGSDSNTVNIPVKGQPLNYQKDKDDLVIHRKIVDGSGNSTNQSDNIVVPIHGNVGDVFNINPNDYLPDPASNYSSSDQNQQIKINASDNNNGYYLSYNDAHRTLLGLNSHSDTGNFYDVNGNAIANPNSGQYKDTIDFTYKENDATANVTYVDNNPSDKVSNSIIGNTVISGAPDTPMAEFYGTYNPSSKNINNLANDLPYGYELDTSINNGYGADNQPSLRNGATYVIYVRNAHLEPKPIPQSPSDYGFITINYGTNLSDSKNAKIYNSVVATGKISDKSDTFDSSNYTKSTINGGYMPNIYNYSKTVGDAPEFYESKPGVMNVDVTVDPTKVGKNVSDKIDYRLTHSDGTTSDRYIKIHGKAGSNINFVPYYDNVPSGYYYNGNTTYDSVYTQGQNNNAPVVATIDVKKAGYENHNRYPDYYPSDTPSDLPARKDNRSKNVNNEGYLKGQNPIGKYMPWNINGTVTNPKTANDPYALLYPGESKHYPDPKNSATQIFENNWSGNSADYFNLSDQGVNKGFVPQGYVPAWVPDNSNDINDGSKYQSGYIPSDYIPSDYVPGYVPSGEISDGLMDYVPGYVPDQSRLQPAHHTITYNDGKKNQTFTIPSYVPGNIKNGRFRDSNNQFVTSDDPNTKGTPDQIPGAVPNDPRFVHNAVAAPITIQYVNAQDPNLNVISQINVKGVTGQSLDFNPGASQDSDDYIDGTFYTNNVPAGYRFESVLGTVANSQYGIQNQTNNGGFKIGGSPVQGQYEFTNNPLTVKVALDQDATGTVVYKSLDPKINNGKPSSDDRQVGTATINGRVGDKLDFSSNVDQTDKSDKYVTIGANKYTRLLPYNYSYDMVDQSIQNGKTELKNGGVYTIYVNQTNQRVAPSPLPQKGYSTITVNYVNQSDNNVIGTNQYTGTNGDNLSNVINISKLTASDKSNGFIPYGYNYDNVVNNVDLTKAKFGTTKTININISKNASYGLPKSDSDKIDYVVVGHDSNGNATEHVLDYSNDGKSLVSSDYVDSKNGNNSANKNKPLTFNIKGQSGNVINYTPYQVNVPNGYYYDGMGNHSSVYDAGHNGTNGNYDTIFLRPAEERIGTGYIQVDYKDNSSRNSDTNNGDVLDTLMLPGRGGKIFDLGYYENNLPYIGSDNYAFNGVVSGGNVDSFNDKLYDKNGNKVPQKVTIGVKPAAPKAPQYGKITIHFVENNGATMTQVPNSQPEVLTGRDGDVFSPQIYERNTPANTTFDHIASGQNVVSFKASTKNPDGSIKQNNDQDVYIAVNSTNGSF